MVKRSRVKVKEEEKGLDGSKGLSGGKELIGAVKTTLDHGGGVSVVGGQEVVSAAKVVAGLSSELLTCGDEHRCVSLLGRLQQLVAGPFAPITDVFKLIQSLLRLQPPPTVLQMCARLCLQVCRSRPNFSSSPVVAEVVKSSMISSNGATRAAGVECMSFTGLEEKAQVLGRFTRDTDYRVRVAALNGLQLMGVRGLAVADVISKAGLTCLHDEVSYVRLAALNAVMMCVEQSKEQVIPADMLFARACSLVLDEFTPVRTRACTLLGKVEHVSAQYVLQSLSKSAISGAELAAVEQSAADAEGDFEVSESLSSLDMVAAGALIHGIEDENAVVRLAAVRTLASIAHAKSGLKNRLLDLMGDMLNDEIDAVRLCTLKCLRELRPSMSDELLQGANALLLDLSLEIRRGVVQLLLVSDLQNETQLHLTVYALLACVRKCSDDIDGCFEALRSLGCRHARLAVDLCVKLCTANPLFVTSEPDVGGDPSYVGTLVFVCSVASVDPAVLLLVPKHIQLHYNLLRGVYPSSFPNIHVVESDGMLLDRPTEAGAQLGSASKDCHVQVLHRVNLAMNGIINLATHGLYRKMKLLAEQGCKALLRVSRVTQVDQAAALKLAYFCLKMWVRLSETDWDTKTEAMWNICRHLSLFSGLSLGDREYLVRLMAASLGKKEVLNRVSSKQTVAEAFDLDIANAAEALCDTRELALKGMDRALPRLVNPASVRFPRCHLVHPQQREMTLSFDSRVPLELKVEVDLYWCFGRQVVISMTADGFHQLYEPPPSDVVQYTPSRSKLRTRIVLTTVPWTGPARARFGVCVRALDHFVELGSLEMDIHPTSK